MLNIILNKNEEINVLNGYPWIYNNEINRFDGTIVNGEVVKVYSYNNTFVCYGFLNTISKIMVRVLSLNEQEVINYDFYKKRVIDAYNHRLNLGFDNCYRLIFSEADYLPGLVVDKYQDYLVVSFLCLGMDMIKKDIVNILIEVINPKGIYERSDSPVRLKEGLEEIKGYLYNEFPLKVIVKENDISLQVDMENGQKTGYFLDQKLNRDYLKYYVKDKVVLDCFSHTGGFALNACKNQAKEVVACDISQKACDDIMFNAKLNNFSNITALCTDVFDYLRSNDIKDKYDVIVLDPPAFTKNKETVKKAYKGYKEINLQALKNIKNGGYLLTFSCSQHMTSDLFLQMVKEAILDSKRKCQMIDFRIQSPDHPTLVTTDSQLYLKCVVIRVIE